MKELQSTVSCTISVIVFWRTCSTRTKSKAKFHYPNGSLSLKTSVGRWHRDLWRTISNAVDCTWCPSSSTTRRPSPTLFMNLKKWFVCFFVFVGFLYLSINLFLYFCYINIYFLPIISSSSSSSSSLSSSSSSFIIILVNRLSIS